MENDHRGYKNSSEGIAAVWIRSLGEAILLSFLFCCRFFGDCLSILWSSFDGCFFFDSFFFGWGILKRRVIEGRTLAPFHYSIANANEL